MNLIKIIEKGLLGVIALLTIVATMQEIISIYMVGRVNLPDLLLLFIYTEVLGMIGVFYVSNKIPIQSINIPKITKIPIIVKTIPSGSNGSPKTKPFKYAVFVTKQSDCA